MRTRRALAACDAAHAPTFAAGTVAIDALTEPTESTTIGVWPVGHARQDPPPRDPRGRSSCWP